MREEKIVSGIVLYNPEIERLQQNIEAILPQVDRIILFNNGSVNIKKIKYLIKKYNKGKIELLEAKNNEGVAKALNEISKVAYKENFQWLLTLDQDTVVKGNLINIYRRYLKLPNLGQLSCDYQDVNLPTKKQDKFAKDNMIKNVRKCITSGTLININALKEVGGFDEKLFIDKVDDDISYLLREKGYCNYKINVLGMMHELGKIKKKEIFGKEVMTSNYNAFRRYYIARNNIIISRRYANEESMKQNLIDQLKEWILILLFEDDKLNKSKAITRGIYDGIKSDSKRKRYF